MTTRESLVFALNVKARRAETSVEDRCLLLEAATSIEGLLKELKYLRERLKAEYKAQAGASL